MFTPAPDIVRKAPYPPDTQDDPTNGTVRQLDVASCLDPRPIVLRTPEKNPVDRSGKRRGFRSALWPTDARTRIGLRDEAKALGDTHLRNVGGGVRAARRRRLLRPWYSR